MRRRTTGTGNAWGAQLENVPNPLLRRSDRVQSTAKKIVTTMIILMLPVAAWIGISTMSSQQDRILDQQGTLHQTTATTTEPRGGTLPVQSDFVVSNTTAVAAQWTYRGVTHEGKIAVPLDSPVGTTQNIWIDANGTRTGPPTTDADATGASFFAGIGAFIVVAVILIGGYMALRFRLDTHRHAQWDRELYTLTS